MKVIFLINALAGGGAEKQLLLTAAGLARAGFDCSIYWLVDHRVPPRIGGLMDEARAAGVALHAPAAGRSFDAQRIREIRGILRTEKDAVLWTWGYRADLAALLLRLSGCRSLIVGSQRSAYEQRIWRFRWIWRLIARTHCAFISNSILNVRQVSKVAPGVGAKTAVIYNAIEDSYFAPALAGSVKPERLRIVMLGNQNAHTKGYDLAVELGGLIKTRGLPMVISIGGAPSDAAALAGAISARGLSDIVVLEGMIANPVAFLRTGDVFLMLSRFEGTPNALLEAMALGLPAVCTRVGDVAAFARDGENIRLIDTGAEAALAALQELWQDWPKARAMAAAGRELCREKFSEPAMIKATVTVLREIQRTGAYRAQGSGLEATP